MKEERTHLEEIGHAALKAGFACNEGLFKEACKTLSTKLPHPTIVKVGANDGVTHDPTADALLSHDNWRGVFIEPVPFCFERLKTNYSSRPNLALENIAIGPEEGDRRFHFVRPEARERYPNLPNWVEMVGSFDKDFVARQIGKAHIVNAFGSLSEYVETVIVKSESLANVVLRHGLMDISLLHIDCEGYDWEVLKSLGEFKPANIYIEHKHLSLFDRTALTAALAERKYRVLDCGADYFAFQPGWWLRVSRESYSHLMRFAR